MIKYTEATRKIKVIEDITCDICGKSTRAENGDFLPDEGDNRFSYATLRFSGGYISSFDGLNVNFNLCEECLVEIIKKSKKSEILLEI